MFCPKKLTIFAIELWSSGMMEFCSLVCMLFSIVFWNVENYFDYFNNGVSTSDAEFSSRGERHWTKKKFHAKTLMIGKTLLWAGKPEIIGLAEVESAFVLRRLCESDVLRKYGYRYLHYDSSDPRGIDVGLLYLSESVEVMKSYVITPPLPTRDILYARIRHRRTGEIWNVYVNHHPSKYGGVSSEGKRIAVMKVLRSSVDSLVARAEGNIVAMGDFNDVPSGKACERLSSGGGLTGGGSSATPGGDLTGGGSSATPGGGLTGGGLSATPGGGLTGGSSATPGGAMPLVNLGRGLEKVNEGSIRFRGYWQLIDNFLVSPDVAVKMKMEVLKPHFLFERDRTWPGEKPRRTFVGPRYNGGVSDHLPVILSINQAR